MRLLEKGPSLASPLDAGERGCKKRLSSGASTTARPAAFSMMFPEKISVTRGNPVSEPTVLRHHSGFLFSNFHISNMCLVGNRYIRRRRQNFKEREEIEE